MEVIGSSNDLFDLDSISRLKYVEACIKEALRVIPTVPIIMRALQANFKLDNGTVLPAGSQVYISLIGLHSSETYYDNPTEYRPERFYGQDDRGQSSFTFVPFSAGPRNCIGQKFAMTDMKVIVSILLRRYRFESLLPFEEFHPKIEVVTKPSQKTPVRLHDRQ